MPYKKQECIVTTVDDRDLKEASVDLNQTSHNKKEELKYKNPVQVNKLIVQILKEFKQEKEKLQADLNEKKQDIQELLTKLESQNKTIKSLEDGNINFKSQIEDFDNSMKENEIILQNHKQEFENIIKLKDEEINSINQTNLGLKNDMESLNNSINEYKEKLSSMKNEKDSIDKTNLETIKNYKNEITKLEEEKNIVLKNNKKREEQLLEEINTFHSNIDEYTHKIHDLKIKKILEEKDYFNKANIYEEKVGELRAEKDEFFMDSNIKISSLLRIIEEKEKMMVKLRKVIKK